MFLASCSSITTEKDSSVAEEESIEVSSTIPKFVEWNPRYTWEEFVISASSDIMTEDNLESFYIWFRKEQEMPIILLEGEGNSLFALIEAEGTTFKVISFDLSEIYDFSAVTSSIEFYDFLETDLDNDGSNELQAFLEISGMAPADDGMRPVHFIKSLVFDWDNEQISYNSQLSQAYNEEIGSASSDANESGIALLNKKYHHLEESDQDHKSIMMSSLIMDMGINAENDESERGFQKISREAEGSYVIYTSFVGRKFFTANEEHSFSELDDLSSSYYPIMIDAYQMTDIYTIQNARVENDVISLSLALIKSESDGLLNEPGESVQAIFTYENGEWILRSNEAYWATEAYSQNFKVIADD